jgi:alpha-tubulin suppressor-like RCC1 family protein
MLSRAVIARCCLISLLILLSASQTAHASLTSPGQLYAFGDNHYGQLGNTTNNGTSTANPTPMSIALPPGVSGFAHISVAHTHTLAVTPEGQLYAWGSNYWGQLGNSTNLESEAVNPTPAVVSLPEGAAVKEAAAGEYFSLVLTTVGQLYAFGDDIYGQLGTAGTLKKGQPNPTPTPVSLPGATGPVIQIAANQRSSYALTATGQLYVFGSNDKGQLGTPTGSGKYEPVAPTLFEVPGDPPIAQVAAGGAHALVLTAAGKVYGFGYNWNGEIGTTTNTKSENPNPTPNLVAIPEAAGSVARIAAGGYHSFALMSDGQLFGWGGNFMGQLGIASHEEVNPTPQLVDLPSEIVEIAPQAYATLALMRSGAVYAFGGNGSGQLGLVEHSAFNEFIPTPTLVSFVGGATVDTISAGPTANNTLVTIADLGITTNSLPLGSQGTGYSSGVSATGGMPPYKWSAMALPPGLSINPASGMIAGVPSQTGGFGLNVTVTDSEGIETSAALPLTINPPINSLTTTTTGGGGGVAPVLSGSKISATAGRTIKSPLAYTVNYTKRYTEFASLTISSLPRGVAITVACAGGGCPFASARVAIGKGCRKGKHCKSKKPGTIDVAPLLQGRHLHPGAHITVELSKAHWIGEAFVLTTRPGRDPRLVTDCLAPGSSAPGKGC